MGQIQGAPGWPPKYPYDQSLTDSIGDGSPDFPASAGGREQGKFRPGSRPKTVTIAVANDDGTPVGAGMLDNSVAELVMELRAIRMGMQLLLSSANVEVDLLDMVATE